MARRNRVRNPSIIASEILLEGPNSNTTARLSFEANKLIFQDTKTGENLLQLDSENRQVNFSSPIKLPDGSLLNTVNDVNIRDFELRASIPVVIYGADGEPKNPNEPITITAFLTNLEDTEAVFSTNPQVELAGTGNTRKLYPGSLIDISKVDITATADEFSETITITKVSEGDDGITVSVTNPSDVISSDSNGEILQADLLNTVGSFNLYKGTTNLTELGRVSYRVDDVVNISININSTTGIYEVTSFDAAADKGSATLVAKYLGIEYTHVYKIVKAKAGQPGQSGTDGRDGQDGESPYVGIVSDENIFIDTINNDNVANINPIAVDQNNVLLATRGTFEIYKGTSLQTSGVSYCVGTSGTNTTETKNNLTFSIEPSTGAYSASVYTTIVQETNGWKTENETFTIRALINGITVSTRKIKIQKTKIGKDGKTGPSLNLNVSPSLFKFNGEGVPVPDQNLTITTLSSNLPENATIEISSIPALTFQDSQQNKILPVENFTDDEGKYLDSAVIKAQVYVSNELYLEDFVTVFRTQNGVDAKSIVLSSESQVFSFSDSDSINPVNSSVLVNIKTQNLTEVIDISDLQVIKNNSVSVSLLPGDLVDNGDGSHTLTINFSSLGITNKKTRDETFPLKIRVDKQQVFDIISIHKLLGGDGALSGYLTNESDQIPAFADGTTQEQDYSTLNGNFKIFKGLEEVTDQCTFEVTFNENMVTTVNSNGFYSTTQNSLSASSNTGRAVIQASLGESDIQKVFTVTKNKQGKNTLNAILSNESHTVRAESDGELVILSDLNSAGGVAVLYDGNERQTSDVLFSVLQGDDTATTSSTSYTTPSGLTLSINSVTGVYTISTTNTTSWTGNTETFYIKIEYDTSTIIKSYTITKSKGGADAKLMTLRANRLVFTFDSDNNASPSSQEIIFTANPTKGSIPLNTPITWSVTPDNATNRSLLKDLNPVDSKKKRILIEDFRTANIQDLQITAESDALEDSITIVKAKDGSSGEDAKTVKVSATSMVVAYDTDEDTTATPDSITVFISQQNLSKVLGTSDVIITKSDNSTVNPSSIDSSGVNSATKTGESFFTISVGETESDLINKNDLPIKIEVNSSSDGVKDVLTINRISGGTDGINGVTTFLTNESHTVPAESNGFVSNDVLSDAGGSYELYDGLTKITNSTGTTDTVVFSVVGGNVLNGVSYLEVQGLRIEVDQSTGIYSLSNVANTSWSRNYQVFTLRADYNNLEFDKKYTLSKSKEGKAGVDGAPGDNGISPINGVLTNESHTVVAAFNGTVSSLAGSGGTFRVYRGQTEITQTNDVSFSVVGTQPQNGLSISIDNTTGATKGEYSLSQTSWTSDSETFILQAIVDTTTVVQKAFTITKSKAGENGEAAKYIILEATKQSFDKNYQGETSVFNPASQTITFTANKYNFSSNPTIEWYVDGNLVSDTSVLTDNGDGTATMSQTQFETATNNLTNLSTTVKSRAVIDSIPYSDQVTVILSQQGKDGSSGRDAKVVSLVADDYQVAFTPSGESWSKEPSQINLTATAKNENQTATIKYYFYVNSAKQIRADDTINTFTISDIENTPDTFTKRNVKVELVEEINGVEEVVATDTVTIFATKEGRDGKPAVTISMPNNNHTFPASALGVVSVSDYATGTTDIEVYIGNTQVQPVSTTVADTDMPNNRFKISNVTATNITAGSLSSASINGLVLTTAAPSSMTEKTASLEFEIKVKDQDGNIKTFIQKQSFTRSDKGSDGSDGAPGADAKALFLLSDSEGFYLNAAGSIVNSTISFNVLKENIDGNVLFSSIPANLLTNIDQINGTADLTYSNFGTNSFVTVSVSSQDGTYTDSIKIKKVESGQKGSDGIDAKVVKLESDDYQIAYDENGNNPEPTTITLKATQQNHSGTVYYRFEENGVEIQNTPSNIKQITLPENKFDTPISIKVETREGSDTGTIIATDSITIVGTKDGSNSYNIVVPNDNHTFVADENGLVSDYSAADTYVEIYIGNTPLVAKTTIDGPNQFSIAIAGSTTNISVATVSPSADATKYEIKNFSDMGIESDIATVPLAITIRGKTDQSQTINKILSYSKARKGATGTASFTGYLTNETHIVVADSNGENYSLVGAGGFFEVFYGSQKLTSAVTYTIQGDSVKFGLTATIDTNGNYSFSGNSWSSDRESFVFRASYQVGTETLNIDKTYSISKSKAGAPSIVGYLTNETHTVQTAYDGTYFSLGNSNGSFEILRGSKTATNDFSFSVDQQIKDQLTASIDENGVYTLSGANWNSDSTSFIFTAVSGTTTIQKTYTITKSKAGSDGIDGTDGANGADGADGANAKAVFLYSDKQAFIKNGDGEWFPESQTINFNASPQNVNANTLSWKVDDIEADASTLTVAADKLSATMTQDQFGLTTQFKKVTVESGVFSDSITVIATKDGAAAKAIVLTSDKQNFRKNGEGNYFSGQKITFTASPKNTDEAIVWSLYKIVGSTETNIASTYLSGMGNTREISVDDYDSILGLDGTGLRVRASTASGLFDDVTIIPVQNGANGESVVSGLLTNESHMVAADSNGQNFSLTGAGGIFQVFFGSQDVTGQANFSVIGSQPQNNLTMSINSSGVYSLSGNLWSSDSETFTLRAEYSNITVEKKYTITKSKAGSNGTNGQDGTDGTDGANAKLIRLSASSQTFKKDKNGLYSPIQQTITLQSNRQNTTATTTTWAIYSRSGNSWIKESPVGDYLSINGDTATITQLAFNDVNSGESVKIRAEADGLFDEITIISVQDGADGLTGASVNTVFIRSSSKPSSPANSSGIPAGWSDDPPSGTATLWASQGTKDVGNTNFSWGEPYQVEGNAVAEVTIYKKTSTTVTPSGGNYNFVTNTLTVPLGWSKTVPSITNNGEKVYLSNAIFSGAPTQTSATATWSTPVIYSQRTDGVDGADAINIEIEQELFTLNANPLGFVQDYSNTGTVIRVSNGDIPLTAASYTISTTFSTSVSGDSNVTVGTITRSGIEATFTGITNISDDVDTAFVTLTINVLLNSYVRTFTKILKYTKIKSSISLDKKEFVKFGQLYDNTDICVGWRSVPSSNYHLDTLPELFELSSTNTILSYYNNWTNGLGIRDGSNIANARGFTIDYSHVGNNKTIGTGPSGPYVGSRYVYTEGSGYYYDYFALQRSLHYSQTRNIGKMSFYYHAYGSDISSLALRIYISEDGGNSYNLQNFTKDVNGSPSVVSVLSGQQQTGHYAAWKKAEVDLTSFKGKNITIRIVSKSGSNNRSDLALDLIQFHEDSQDLSNIQYTKYYDSEILTDFAGLRAADESFNPIFVFDGTQVYQPIYSGFSGLIDDTDSRKIYSYPIPIQTDKQYVFKLRFFPYGATTVKASVIYFTRNLETQKIEYLDHVYKHFDFPSGTITTEYSVLLSGTRDANEYEKEVDTEGRFPQSTAFAVISIEIDDNYCFVDLATIEEYTFSADSSGRLKNELLPAKIGLNRSNVLSDLHLKQSYNGNGGGLILERSSDFYKWNIRVENSAYLYFLYGSNSDNSSVSQKGYLTTSRSNSEITFTGQHRNKGKEENLYNISNVGMIVVSSGEYNNLDGFQNITINESLPTVILSNKRKQKNVWGVISDKEDPNIGREHSAGRFVSTYDILENDDRLIINSLGEGGVWVCNINGNLENGDYITTCEVPGYGMKQDDDLLHNYTVAKITCDCDFDLESPIYICEEFTWEGQIYRRAFVGCTYHCG